ncbi:reverse transcriptase domain-containing protein [Tanacetum coccineum]|uniref:Reverse transcriptase domain-containing protein n=1 Tax=Tanacetum coccineum TaxID=301880 RepID=A0ABQ5AUN9_9ASTR
MIAAAVANALPNLTAALRTQITNGIRNGVESSGGSGGGGGDAAPQGIHVWIERFNKLKPLAFRSAATPAEAEDWITHMEKLFQVGGDVFTDTCTWVAFREIFYNRYFPSSKQQRYEHEYGSIYQLDRENSEQRTGSALVKVSSGPRVVSIGSSRSGYDSKTQDFLGQEQCNNRFLQVRRRSTETLPPPPLCTTCGKPHQVKDCPQAKQKQNMPTDFARLPPTTGRVYATTRDQAAKTSGTIIGNLYIDDRIIFILFDTGATHSIISTAFAKKLNMNPTPLIERIIISTSMKNHMLIDHEYVNCPLRFDDRIRPANLLPIHKLRL